MFDMVLDIRLDFLSFFCCGSQRVTRDFSIYAKLIIVLTPNLELSPYSNVIHGNTTFKLTKSSQRLKKNDNHSVWCFWSFFHFIFVPDNKCHKQKWCVLFFFYTHQTSGACDGTHQMEQTALASSGIFIPKILIYSFAILFIVIWRK